uniref:Uncharacterized protein n=1 Tax=Rhizophora mucronata TaxID=61149 RepID=A0A2P2NNJ9_RHIMU
MPLDSLRQSELLFLVYDKKLHPVFLLLLLQVCSAKKHFLPSTLK